MLALHNYNKICGSEIYNPSEQMLEKKATKKFDMDLETQSNVAVKIMDVLGLESDFSQGGITMSSGMGNVNLIDLCKDKESLVIAVALAPELFRNLGVKKEPGQDNINLKVFVESPLGKSGGHRKILSAEKDEPKEVNDGSQSIDPFSDKIQEDPVKPSDRMKSLDQMLQGIESPVPNIKEDNLMSAKSNKDQPLILEGDSDEILTDREERQRVLETLQAAEGKLAKFDASPISPLSNF